MPNATGSDYLFDRSDDFWKKGLAVQDAQVDAEFLRLKAERLERGQARLLADLNLDANLDAWKRRRLAEMQAGRVQLRPRPIPPSRLLWLAVMCWAIAVGAWYLGWGR